MISNTDSTLFIYFNWYILVKVYRHGRPAPGSREAPWFISKVEFVDVAFVEHKGSAEHDLATAHFDASEPTGRDRRVACLEFSIG